MQKYPIKNQIIYLLEPKREFTQDFSILRNYLRKWRIPFQEQHGINRLQELFEQTKYHYIIVVNSRDLDDTRILQDLSSKLSAQIYCYPLKNSKFPTLRSPSQIVDIYERQNTQRIKLLNIKKIDKQNSQKLSSAYCQNWHQRNYNKIILYSEDKRSSLIDRLMNILSGQQRIQYNYGKPNELLSYGRFKAKILVIIGIEDFEKIKKQLEKENILKNYDFAVLGLKKSKNNFDNSIILLTEDTRNVLELIDLSGVLIPTAIEKYIENDRKIKMMRELGRNVNSNDDMDFIIEKQKNQNDKCMTVIHEVSDEYQGSNKDSYLVEQNPKTPADQNGNNSKRALYENSRSREDLYGEIKLKSKFSLQESPKNIGKDENMRVVQNNQTITTHDYWDSEYQIKTIEEKSPTDSVNSQTEQKSPILQKQAPKIEQIRKIYKNDNESINNKYPKSLQKNEEKQYSMKKYPVNSYEQEVRPPKNVQNQVSVQTTNYQPVRFAQNNNFQRVPIYNRTQQYQNQHRNYSHEPQLKKYIDNTQSNTLMHTPTNQKIYHHKIHSQQKLAYEGKIFAMNSKQQVKSQSPTSRVQLPSIYYNTEKNSVKHSHFSNFSNKNTQEDSPYNNRSLGIVTPQKNEANNKRIISSTSIDLTKYDRIQQNGRVIYRPKQVSVSKNNYTQDSPYNKKVSQNFSSNTSIKFKQEQIVPKMVESEYYGNHNKKSEERSKSRRRVRQFQTESTHKNNTRVYYDKPQNKQQKIREHIPLQTSLTQKKQSLFESKQDIRISMEKKENTNNKQLIQSQSKERNHKISRKGETTNRKQATYTSTTPGISTYNQTSTPNSIIATESNKPTTVPNRHKNYREEARSSSSYYTTDDRKFNRDSSAIKDSSDFSALELYHDGQGQLYNSFKPYYNSIITRVESSQQFCQLEKQFSSLLLQPNCFHYLIESNHPYLSQISQSVSFRDKLEVCGNISQIQQKMSKKSLPNETYDLGFVFISDIREFNRDYHRPGYFFVDIDRSYREIDISKSRNQIKIAKFQNLQLAQKLVIASLIEHYVFYHKDDRDASKLIKLFPAAIFHKSYYQNYNDLSEKLLKYANLRQKCRLKRVIILGNEKNIDQINRFCDHELNVGNIEVFCNVGIDRDSERMMKQYSKVRFISDYQFSSYGSLIKFSPEAKQAQSILGENKRDEDKKQIIYLDHKHETSMPDLILSYLLNKYQIKYFQTLEQLGHPNKNETVLLHQKSNYIGSDLNARDYEAVYMVGNPKTRLLQGVIRIDSADILEVL